MRLASKAVTELSSEVLKEIRIAVFTGIAVDGQRVELRYFNAGITDNTLNCHPGKLWLAEDAAGLSVVD